ncbi:DUF6078 family protein [Parabacteroides sp. OttesenSCG-928-B22]|nr:DUF6078 family protein [Parabacteroides sp. OttesenSCG-928-B22]
MKENFNYNDVPVDYLQCLNDQCPRSGDCLRFQTALQANSETISFLVVNPVYMQTREECPFWQADQLTRFALGFNNALSTLPRKEAAQIRKILYEHFGRSMYYRIRNRERLIRPEEQAFIQQVFQNEGLQENLVFDTYVEQYDW